MGGDRGSTWRADLADGGVEQQGSRGGRNVQPSSTAVGVFIQTLNLIGRPWTPRGIVFTIKCHNIFPSRQQGHVFSL